MRSSPARAEDGGGADHVDEQPDGRDGDQPAAGHVGRIGEPPGGADEDDDRDHDQRDGVDEGGQDLGALEPEAAVRRRRPAREQNRTRRDRERDDVGEVVAGVGEQREAAGEERRDDLDERVGRVEDERDRQRPQRAARRRVDVKPPDRGRDRARDLRS